MVDTIMLMSYDKPTDLAGFTGCIVEKIGLQGRGWQGRSELFLQRKTAPQADVQLTDLLNFHVCRGNNNIKSNHESSSIPLSS